MIDVTRLNGHPMAVNCDLVKFVEATPDTTLTLITGERLIVRESCAQLVAQIAAWRAHILSTAWPSAASALSTASAHEIVRVPASPEDQ